DGNRTGLPFALSGWQASAGKLAVEYWKKDMAKHKTRTRRKWMVPGLAVSAVLLAGGWIEPPKPGPFYQLEAEELTGAPGDILRIEPLAGAPEGAVAWRVLYVSTGLSD